MEVALEHLQQALAIWLQHLGAQHLKSAQAEHLIGRVLVAVIAQKTTRSEKLGP